MQKIALKDALDYEISPEYRIYLAGILCALTHNNEEREG